MGFDTKDLWRTYILQWYNIFCYAHFSLELLLRIAGCYRMLKTVAKSFSQFILSYMMFLCWLNIVFIYIYIYISIVYVKSFSVWFRMRTWHWNMNDSLFLESKWTYSWLFQLIMKKCYMKYWLCKVILSHLQVNTWLYLSFFKTMLDLLDYRLHFLFKIIL